MIPKAFSRLDFRFQRGLPITFNHDRILKLGKVACLRHCNFFTPRSLKKLGVGKRVYPIDRTMQT